MSNRNGVSGGAVADKEFSARGIPGKLLQVIPPLRSLIFYRTMREKTTNNETYPFRRPQGSRTIRFRLTAEAVEWLNGTTKDNGDRPVGNHTLFCDLLSRMRLSPGRDDSFRRPQELQPGQFQFSETRLAEEWNVGRKRIRNLLATLEKLGMIAVEASRTASVASMTCVEGWTDFQGHSVIKPCNLGTDGI